MAFITIEGIEGAGKSTLRAQLAERLAALGREVVLTREPGATVLGQSLRSLLLDANNINIDPVTELLLFYADRTQHLREIVRPALERKAVVLCDRFNHSTIAYQGYGRGIPLETLATLTQIATGGMKPDCVLLLDLSPQQGLERAKRRTLAAVTGEARDAGKDDSWNRFEQQQLDFHQRVRTGFLELSKDPANRFTVLDATKTPAELAEQAFAAVEKVL